ncbi:hypothetical protein VTL71DRAFT_12799 [Oculimacula yallundae]|uniref:rRNA methyltransferase 1, mitochondrial n=1 Tax=Oculimacula yallundae TaxID=86028 RepID=A0ABR4CP21_9HELO
MTSRLLLRRNDYLRTHVSSSPLLPLNSISIRFYHAGHASSVNTAIARGLRKSKGIGFRGPRKPSPDDPREIYRNNNGIAAYDRTGDGSVSRARKESRETRERRDPKSNRWEGRGEGSKARPRPPRGNVIERSDGFGNSEVFGRYGEKVAARIRKVEYKDSSRGAGSQREQGSDSRSAYPSLSPRDKPSGSTSQIRLADIKSSGRTSESRFGSSNGFDRSKDRFGSEREQSGLGNAPQSDRYGNVGKDNSPGRASNPFEPRSSPRDRSSAERYSPGRPDAARSNRFGDRNDRPNKTEYSKDSSSSFASRSPGRIEESKDGRFNRDGPKRGSSSERTIKLDRKADSDVAKPYGARTDRHSEPTSGRVNSFDKHIPLSIPYTTPASEFLYGHSVVEAAISSRRTPRRKLYKLYIYNGENRLEESRDERLKRLAKQNGIEVVRVGNDWIRLLDKMSGGRPHNGYILEASPLPRLPVTHLGEYKSNNGEEGFEIALDHQSREEAAINGTSNFIRTTATQTGRKPLVLLLDGIVDPGNMGGIIRTASFLGVSAIAISNRNSAPMTPVTLKASAGASENITLFSVSKPAGFLVDSKAAGWKVYAAVAPTQNHYGAIRQSVSTDELDDPLSEAPSILMLGGEGDGLRGLLKSKADVELYIQGSGQAFNVDSLNVSVAAGILCNSFLAAKKGGREAVVVAEEKEQPVGEPVVEKEMETAASDNSIF